MGCQMSNKEQERRTTLMMDIFGMVIFGILGIVTFVAGCCGKHHQFALFAICVVMAGGFYLEYKNIKSK